MANYRIPGPLGMCHSQQPPRDPLTRQPQRIPGPLGSHCEYQLKQQLKIELEKEEIALDICQLILDITGIIDPTPASDGTNVLISLSRGRWIDAVISVVSIVPYVGDFAKLGKLPRYLKSIKKAIRIAQTDFHWSNALKRLFIPLKKVIDQLYELGANKLPPHASKTLSQIKREIDHFLKPASSGTTANQTVGEFLANSSKNSSPKVKQSANTPSKSKQANIEEKPKKGVSSEKESGIIDGKRGKNVDVETNPDFIATSNGDAAKISDLSPNKRKATLRELRVAEIVDGKSATRSRIRKQDSKLIIEDKPIIRDGKVVTGIDVFGKNGELIQVGGPGKNANDVVFEKTKRALEALKDEAKLRGTKAQVFYEKGNSDRFKELITESKRILGEENVFILSN